MRRTLVILAAALIAAPVFAHDDDEWTDGQYGSSYDAPPPPPDAYDAPAPPDDGPSLADFRDDDSLAWSGRWIDTPEYGTVWQPTQVSSEWRPYSYGRWAYTDYGWTWVSDESFGWAVYHYGRWALVDGIGWVWQPGRTWAPAWVSWRYDGEVVGWCALGPRQVVWERPAAWVFVETRYIVEPVQHHTIALPVSGWSTGPRALPARAMVAGPPRASIERALGRAIRPVHVVEVSAPRAVQSSGGAVTIYRPHGGPASERPMVRSFGAATAHSRDERVAPRAVERQWSAPRASPAPWRSAPLPSQPAAPARVQPALPARPPPTAPVSPAPRVHESNRAYESATSPRSAPSYPRPGAYASHDAPHSAPYARAGGWQAAPHAQVEQRGGEGPHVRH